MNITVKEALAALEHEQWAHWMRYMFECGTFNEDGTWTMPEDKVVRWTRQMSLPYVALTEKEKDSDRLEAERTMALLGL